MSRVKVTWGRRVAIGPDRLDQIRTMEREFGGPKKAAEFACDIIYMIDGPDGANAWSEKLYTVSRDKPRAQFENAVRDEYVLVEYLPAVV